MKFGKNIGVQQEARQDLHYVDYKMLKKLIKEVVALKKNEIADALTANTAFEEELAKEITQVNACFARCQHELLERTASMAEMLKTGTSASSAACEDSPVYRPEAFRSLVSILGEVDQLRKYAVWNAMAVVKILKKRRKQSQFGLADTFGERAGWLSRQSFFNSSDFAELHVAIESLGDLLMRSQIVPGELARTVPQKQEAQQCPICFETISDMVELSCHHRFCWKCFVLGPIAHQPGQYRITQCPICRKETTQTQAEDDGTSDRQVVSSSSEGLLTRFLHTYFPQEQGQSAEGEEGHAWSEAKRESEQMQDVVGEFVTALLADIGAQPAMGEGASDESGRHPQRSSSSGGIGGSAICPGVPSDFFQTLPVKSQQERTLMGATQKLAWLQLASNGDPLATDGAAYCFLCSESLLMETVVTTPCKHSFHKTCINRIDMPHCPICSADLPLSWFLPKDHPCIERGFRLVQPHNYQPAFPGGPSRGSRGYPLWRPPPVSLFGAGGLTMKSYLHTLLPAGDTDEVEDVVNQSLSQTSASQAPAAKESPEATDTDDAASSPSESSSEESGSEGGHSRRKRTWVWGTLGKMRLLPHEPGVATALQEDREAMPMVVGTGPTAGLGAPSSAFPHASVAASWVPAKVAQVQGAVSSDAFTASTHAASETGRCSKQVLLIDNFV